MTPDETAVLLAGIAAYDTRYKQQGEDAAFTVRIWSHALATVDLEWAAAYVTWWYKNKTDKIFVGHLIAAWNAATAREDVREAQTEQRAAIGEVLRERPGWWDTFRRKVDMTASWATARGVSPTEWSAARAAALQAVAAVPSPTGVLADPSPREERERRCFHWRTCVCTHDQCYGGFLQAEAVFQGENGNWYQGVTPCDRCREAVAMAEELRPAKKGKRR